MNISSAVIFGGATGWGKRIYDSVDTIIDEVSIIEVGASPTETIDFVKKCDLIFIAIPDSQINSKLIEIRNFLRKDQIVIECATSKSGFSNTLKEIAVSGVSVCSTHPMVMPASSPKGYNVLIMPIGNNFEKAKKIAEQIYLKMDMIPQDFEFENHADAMVIVQMVPHLVQRILIDSLGHGVSMKNMTIEDISRIAPANYILAELGLGRVAVQRTSVSAGIVATGLQNSFGRRILGGMQSIIGRIISAGDNREELEEIFQSGITTLDPAGVWRHGMEIKTEAALIRLGNLRSKSFSLQAPNKPNVLRDILNILEKYDIDMTALDSQILSDNDGNIFAKFDIGASDINFNSLSLKNDLEKIGVVLLCTD